MDNSELDEVVGEFIVESHENLDQLDQELIALEQVADPDVLARIFRTIHTIKGTAGFLGFSSLEVVTHAGENLLSKLRDGELVADGAITDALLAMVDVVRAILAHIEVTGQESGTTYPDLVDRLQRLVDGGGDGAERAPAEPEPAPEPELDPVELADVRPLTPALLTLVDDTPGLAPVDDDSEANLPIGERLLRQGLITEEQLTDALRAQEVGDPRHIGELLVERAKVPPDEVVQVLKAQADERSAAGETIRVDVGLLDDLMTLVGELVLARNQILQFTHHSHDQTFNAASQRLNLITTELQEGVMKTRMQPIEHVWNKFPRVVRDLSATCGKRARLEMEGRHTELDKTLLEAIKDPLTHLVRNAVDHGLERPEAREASGKQAEGVVRLRAFHEGGQVVVEISDDGAGIDPDVLRRKAVQRGLLGAEEAAGRSDHDIVSVIFLPGFSTAETVSNISGRGVGMDVVRTNIEGIGGSIDVQSTLGVGTTFTIKIPLTLAIIPALIVTSGGDRYAIPQVSLCELVHAEARGDRPLVEYVHGAPVFRLRGRLLPLVFLGDVFDGTTTSAPDAVDIVVLQADDQQFGLVVDQIDDTAEIVVKPLGRLLKSTAGFAGATIMGDGRVALILDVAGLAHLAQVRSSVNRAGLDAQHAEHADDADGRESMLLVGIGDRRFVLSVTTVARLEELPTSAIRDAGDRQVVHYRDEILPIVSLADRLGIHCGTGDPSTVKVLVCGAAGGQLGLVVDAIHDIADERVEISRRTSAYGVQGTAVIHGEVTDVLDLDVLVGEAAAAVGVAA